MQIPHLAGCSTDDDNGHLIKAGRLKFCKGLGQGLFPTAILTDSQVSMMIEVRFTA
jgi:hypothetical protein